jgi:hypothetical protein
MSGDRRRGAVTAAATTATATLVSGGLETRYERAGAGAPVLLLAPVGASPKMVDPARQDPAREGPARKDPLFARLARSFRVIRPVGLPGRIEDAGGAAGRPAPLPEVSWLRGLIDGLGLGRCALVAADPFCLAALTLALGDADRVSALVLLHRREADPGAPVLVAGRLEATRQRLLVVGCSGPGNGSAVPAAIAQEIETFLLRGEAAPEGPGSL